MRMRFEIKSGGAFVILLGLVGLSGAVFSLGLVAGYEMARQTQPDLNQISSVFPVPSPGASEESPAATPASPFAPPSFAAAPRPTIGEVAPRPSIAAAAPTHAPIALASPAVIARPKPPVARPSVAMARPSVAPVARPSIAYAPPPPPPAGPEALPSPEGEAGAMHGGKPYNIQIEAVMDKAGADAMLVRLKALGYEPHETETVIDGQLWYRVQIGPYATEEEARDAQTKLRAKYRSKYISPEGDAASP
jgi:DedD protein